MTGPRDDTLAGRVLDGRYRLEARIGGGGMGEVYRARHLMMDQRVAIKLLHPDLAADPTAARRFVREAKATFRIDHPNCIRVTDFGATDEGTLYLVMEYLDGRTVLDELRVDGPMDPRRVVHIARQVCDALDCAHALGLLHRDLKPGNIMLLQRGQDVDTAKVLDFGLAKLLTGPDGALTAAFSMSPLTREGMVFGTPEYMSPEQAIDEPLTALSDIYSLGVVMYEMLTAAVPFESESFMAVLTMHVRETPRPPRLRRPDLLIPEALEAVVLQCLAKAPENRPAGARALSLMLAELEHSLAAPVARVSTQVASSSTVDLDAQAVSTAAAQASVARMPAQDVRALSLAETLIPGAAIEPQTVREAVAASSPRTATLPRRSRTYWAVAGSALLVGAAVAIIAGVTGDAGSGASRQTAPGTRAISSARPDAAVALAADAGVARPDASAPALADAALADAATERRSRPAASATTRRVRAHIAAAERARQEGNRLRQMAEADSALRLAPGNRDAAYLLGDALVASDRARGCRYLRQARRLRKARRAYEAARCGRTD